MQGFVATPAGPVPRVAIRLSRLDWWQTFLARAGSIRDDYKIVPGLYCVGEAGPESPVLVTANYKLTFDSVRKELSGHAAWILVLDTHGINVWCAAGKGTFGTEELAHRIRHTELEKVVSHREVIVPQLGAPGVSGFKVRKLCGFKVRFGPVYAKDVPAYLATGEVTEAMRTATFTLRERAVLVPVEFWLLKQIVPWALVVLFVLSGIGPGVFSLAAGWERGIQGLAACIAGTVAGAALTPLLLPWLPHRAFAVKGAVTGVVLGLVPAIGFWSATGPWGALALLLWSSAVGSYLGMNFTGSTPYTSPSGVEKEMRLALPLQAAAVVLGVLFWITAAFTGGVA